MISMKQGYTPTPVKSCLLYASSLKVFFLLLLRNHACTINTHSHTNIKTEVVTVTNTAQFHNDTLALYCIKATPIKGKIWHILAQNFNDI